MADIDSPFEMIAAMAARARRASRALAHQPTSAKANGLRAAAEAVRADLAGILLANSEDMARAVANDLSGAMQDRLRLDAGRVEAIADAIEAVAALPDPVGEVIDTRTRPNGLELTRVRVPLGVLGIIYESRPNVTADAAALAVMSGNAAILRGGSEAAHSNRAIHAAFTNGLAEAGLPTLRREHLTMAALSAKPRVAFSRRQLVTEVWGGDWGGDDHLVDVHVAHVRRKLGDDPQEPRFILTVRGVGYRMGPGA